jgi:hypothetical protein
MSDAEKKLQEALMQMFEADENDLVPSLICTACEMIMNRNKLSQKKAAHLIILMIRHHILKEPDINWSEPK